MSAAEQVHHPTHYNGHPSGIECWDVVRFMSFNLGSALKYAFRAGAKGDAATDWSKCLEYIRDDIDRPPGHDIVPAIPPDVLREVDGRVRAIATAEPNLDRQAVFSCLWSADRRIGVKRRNRLWAAHWAADRLRTQAIRAVEQ